MGFKDELKLRLLDVLLKFSFSVEITEYICVIE